MIVGNIKDCERYLSVNKNFEKAFAFLKTLNKNSEDGSFEFEEFSGSVCSIETSDLAIEGSEKKLEAHREYLDIHYVIDGAESVGYAHVKNLTAVTDYYAEQDYLLLSGEMNKIVLNERDFCVVFPEDAHAPGMCGNKNKNLKKAVVKIRL
jgi:biofilm protein TabA